MNTKLLKFTLITAFLLIGTIGAVQAQDSQVGVKVGDSFNYQVTKNDFSQAALNLNDLLSSLNTSTISTDYNIPMDNLTSMIQTFNVSELPAVGSVLGVTVVSLPSSSSDQLTGALNITDGTTTKTVTTGFMIGTPVATTNWTYWKAAIYDLQTTSSSAEPTVTPGVYSNAQTFNATVDMTFNQISNYITSTSSSYSFTSLKVSLAASYDASTGVLKSESVTVTLDGQIPLSMSFAIASTTKGVSSGQNTVTTSTPGFEVLALLAALPVVAFLYKRNN
jgi:hypothetical protein